MGNRGGGLIVKVRILGFSRYLINIGRRKVGIEGSIRSLMELVWIVGNSFSGK